MNPTTFIPTTEPFTALRRAEVSRRRGLAMVMVMVALVAATIITLSFLSSQTTSTAIAHNATQQVQARAIAEDGLRLVVEHLRNDAGWRDSQTHGVWAAWDAISGGEFRVMFEDEDDSDLSDDVSDAFIVTIEGAFNGVVHRISNRVVPSATSSALTVMFIAGDSFQAEEDLERIAAIESWGHKVLTVTDSDSQSEYDAAAAKADVVYISEEVNSGSVGTKLNGYAIGVVNEEQALQDELQMSTRGGAYTGDSINVTDNTHPITAGLPIGVVKITENATALTQARGTPADGLTALAERESSTIQVLTLLDIGDTMTDGNPSPQRRVTLPFGTNRFEYGELNRNGKRLMRQAIEWAGQDVAGISGDSYGDARWPLDDVSGTTALEVIGGANGTYVGGPSLNQAGVAGTAVALTSSTDRITLPASSFDGLEAMTFGIWIKTTRTGEQVLLSASTAAYGDALRIRMRSATILEINIKSRVGSSGSSFSSSRSIPSVADGEWHHLVVVVDRASGRLTSYRNGQVLGASNATLPAIQAEHVVLGENQGAVDAGYDSSKAFVGLMDDAVLFASALTDAQVLTLYENTLDAAGGTDGPQLLVRYEFVEPDPVAPVQIGHWRLDEPASGGAGPGVAINGDITLFNNAMIDSYDSIAGAYTLASAGQNAHLATNSTVTNSLELQGPVTVHGDISTGVGSTPADVIFKQTGPTVTGSEQALSQALDLSDIVAPTAPPSSGHLSTFGSEGTTITVTEDTRYSGASLSGNGKLIIDGDITLWFDGFVGVSSTAEIQLTPGSRATIYIDGGLSVSQDAHVNRTSSDPTALTVNLTGTGRRADLATNMTFFGTLNNPAGDVVISNNAEFFGKISGGTFQLSGDAQVHVDTQLAGGGVPVVQDEILENHGDAIGPPQQGRPGQDGTSYEFNGVDQFVEVPHDDAYLLNEGTVACWFYADDVSGTQVYVSKDGYYGADNGYLGLGQIGSTLVAVMRGDDANVVITSSSGLVQPGRWNHVAFGFGPGGMRLYFNGTLVASQSDYTGGLWTTSGGAGNTSPWLFGAEQMNVSTIQNFLDGRLDDVQLYDRNLTAEQVADVIAQTAPRSVVPPIVEDTSGSVAALDLAIADPDHVTWISGGGLTVDTGTTISSGTATSRLQAAVAASDQVTVEAVFTPANITQDGPARIVSYSNGTANRNFHLGQTDAAYDVRLRTELNLSGTPSIESGDVLAAGLREHVVFTYDGVNEELRVYRNGVLEFTEPWAGDLDNWNAGYELLVANEVGGARPWLGTLHRVGIYDGAVNRIQAENLFNEQPPGDGTGGEEGLAYQIEWLESP